MRPDIHPRSPIDEYEFFVGLFQLEPLFWHLGFQLVIGFVRIEFAKFRLVIEPLVRLVRLR